MVLAVRHDLEPVEIRRTAGPRERERVLVEEDFVAPEHWLAAGVLVTDVDRAAQALDEREQPHPVEGPHLLDRLSPLTGGEQSGGQEDENL